MKQNQFIAFFSILLSVILLLQACNKNNKGLSSYKSRTSYFKNIRTDNYNDSIIKCVTFNIQLGFTANTNPWTVADTGATAVHLENMKRYLNILSPDIICLQEVPHNRHNTIIKDFIERLAISLNMNYAFGSHGYNDPTGVIPVKGEWGNSILSKYPILSINNFENEFISVWERRSILTATIINKGAIIRVHSLHFLPTPKAEASALSYINQWADAPQLVMGDFNMSSLPLFETSSYTDVFKADSSLGGLHDAIDRILHTRNRFTTLVMGSIPDTISVFPALISDHLANYAVLKTR